MWPSSSYHEQTGTLSCLLTSLTNVKEEDQDDLQRCQARKIVVLKSGEVGAGARRAREAQARTRRQVPG